jgi:hypothetical protein
MALLEEQGTDLREARTDRGSARLWVLAPTVYVTSVTGHMEDVHADLFESYGLERIRKAPGKLVVFHDWFDMTGYESRCRTRLTSWSVKRIEHYEEVHLGVRSKLVAMGVQVANIALRGLITAHSDRAKLEVELRRALRDKGRV